MLNLARRPFVNRRPARRLTVLLWALAAVLTSVNLVLFWGYQSGSSEARSDLRSLQDELRTEGQQLADLRDEFRSFDLEVQNEQVSYLNDRFLERRFPWSQLFVDLEEVLPLDVRLQNLRPRDANEEGEQNRRHQRRAVEAADKWIQIQFGGLAKDSEELLVFLEQLFAHPAFASPDLRSESATKTGELQFQMSVEYLVRRSVPATTDLELTAIETSPVEAAREKTLEVADERTSSPTGDEIGEEISISESPSNESTPLAAGLDERSAEREESLPFRQEASERRVTAPDEESALPSAAARDRSESGSGAGGDTTGSSVAPAARVVLGTNAGRPSGPTTPSPANNNAPSAESQPAQQPSGRRSLGPEDLPERPTTNQGRDRRSDRDRRDLFPERDASGGGA